MEHMIAGAVVRRVSEASGVAQAGDAYRRRGNVCHGGTSSKDVRHFRGMTMARGGRCVRGKGIMAYSWGRIVAVVLSVSLAFLAGAMLPRPAQSMANPQLVTSYTVQPGDTLWSYAESITPQGGDVRDTVSKLAELNHLDDESLETGQRLLVPVD